MKCMNCGATLTESVYCPKCGCDVSVQKQAIVLSGLYYNQGLEKAQIRDLSGAIDQLKRSLKFNKANIPARNLLGLVYFETGEVVSALSEWVISKNIQPEHNIASEYIDNLRQDANRLDVINQTIKKYNLALENCGNGNEDVAEIQLKKILAQNPKLIKGYHLLSLLYLKKGEYEKARRLLKKAARIDKTNTTTLRFLKEVDEQTGTATSLEPRRHLWQGREPQDPAASVPAVGGIMTEDRSVIQPVTYNERSTGFTIFNIILGLIIGAVCVWFLFVPARVQSINKAANEKVSQYSSQMATQSAEVDRLRQQIKSSEETVETANTQISEAEATTAAYRDLLTALNAVYNRSYSKAAEAIAKVDVSYLSADAKEIYDTIYVQAGTALLAQYRDEGVAAFNSQDYAGAIAALEKAKAIDPQNYDVLNYLAHAYRLSGDLPSADANFQAIIDNYPGTARSENARIYMSGAEPAPTPVQEAQGGEAAEIQDSEAEENSLPAETPQEEITEPVEAEETGNE